MKMQHGLALDKNEALKGLFELLQNRIPNINIDKEEIERLIRYDFNNLAVYAHSIAKAIEEEVIAEKSDAQ